MSHPRSLLSIARSKRATSLVRPVSCSRVRITGDRYAAEWVTEAFADRGIDYLPAKSPASQIYLAVEPLFNIGTVTIPDHRQLIGELRNLERRTTKSGKVSVDHPPTGHDDLANSVCGPLWLLAGEDAPQPGIRTFDDGPGVRVVESGLGQPIQGFGSGWEQHF